MPSLLIRTGYLLAAVATALAGASNTPAPAPGAIRQVFVGPEDTVTIYALNVEEISKAWRVNSSGELSLPMVGSLKAAGLTIADLERAITGRLRKYVKDPQVTAYISESRSHPVTVSGAVAKPGVVQLDGPTRLFDVIVKAGGPLDAGPELTLTRSVHYEAIDYPGVQQTADGKFGVLQLPLPEVMRGDTEVANLTVLPYDVISVTSGKVPRLVYISGEVGRPGTIELVHQDSISLSKALAIAGGVNRTAAPSKAILRHIDSNGIETAFTFVNLKRILSGKAKDISLTEGDVLVVPSSQIMTYLSAASTSAINTGMLVLARF